MGYALLCYEEREWQWFHPFRYSWSIVKEGNVTYGAFDRVNSLQSFLVEGSLGLAEGRNPFSPAVTFAISHDLGTILATQTPIVWAIGYTTDPAVDAVQFDSSSQNARSPYYKLRYPNDESLVTPFFFNNTLSNIFCSDPRFPKWFWQCFSKGSTTGSEDTPGRYVCLSSARRFGFLGSAASIWQLAAHYWNRRKWKFKRVRCNDVHEECWWRDTRVSQYE